MTIEEKIKYWESAVFDADTQQELQQLKQSPKLLEDAFYKDLSFGTGGMRGIMGVGTNRINKYTLARCTQGLSNYLHEQFPSTQPKVVIAYDSRHNSQSLATEVAAVFAANKVEVFLFTDLRTTPELSFAVRHLKAQAGIVLTASHNPPAYNGYKVYWEDGAQIVGPHDEQIMDRISKVEYGDLKFDPPQATIHPIDLEVDKAYQKTVLGLLPKPAKKPSNLKIVFTPLHGTAITAIPSVLEAAGFEHVSIVKNQMHPDGAFPTVESPNPEEREALSMAIKQAGKEKADIIIGTDPDCDRLGVGFRTHEGTYELLNGNQLMILMTDYVLESLHKKRKLPKRSFIASTIVSTPLMESIAKHYGIEYVETLTGFKWIADAIEKKSRYRFLCGGEESYGFLLGTAVRDKDAVSAALLAAVLASDLKSKGITFQEQLIHCYGKYGFRYEKLLSIKKEGIEGARAIENMMQQYRTNPPSSFGGKKVVKVSDYLEKTELNLINKESKSIALPASNVLLFEMENGSRVALRPSGTEPKIKFYLSASSYYEEAISWEDNMNQIQFQLKALEKDLQL